MENAQFQNSHTGEHTVLASSAGCGWERDMGGAVAIAMPLPPEVMTSGAPGRCPPSSSPPTPSSSTLRADPLRCAQPRCIRCASKNRLLGRVQRGSPRPALASLCLGACHFLPIFVADSNASCLVCLTLLLLCLFTIPPSQLLVLLQKRPRVEHYQLDCDALRTQL